MVNGFFDAAGGDFVIVDSICQGNCGKVEELVLGVGGLAHADSVGLVEWLELIEMLVIASWLGMELELMISLFESGGC